MIMYIKFKEQCGCSVLCLGIAIWLRCWLSEGSGGEESETMGRASGRVQGTCQVAWLTCYMVEESMRCPRRIDGTRWPVAWTGGWEREWVKEQSLFAVVGDIAYI